ncbi:hypothetical protein PRIPAC_97387 [Pristionchus pacificus]|uniref:Uncharacterized protein n=1 Tax=Pristionchus pacificus TaxID=54126 RepID=A0A454Y608_PRIPA|nr:hypothetical protein PRIPAC_97387 [Pristionchus pacificus]|eukprot:PDM66150.1 hypothetical protein PRIPAC_45375 [Pristionchus pacificus]
MAEAHEVIDISSDEEESYDGSEPGYSPASPSDSVYNNSRSDSDDFPEPEYSPVSPSDSNFNNSLSDSDDFQYCRVSSILKKLPCLPKNIQIVVQCSFVDIFSA